MLDSTATHAAPAANSTSTASTTLGTAAISARGTAYARLAASISWLSDKRRPSPGRTRAPATAPAPRAPSSNP